MNKAILQESTQKSIYFLATVFVYYYGKPAKPLLARSILAGLFLHISQITVNKVGVYEL
jgi:hypothetical protein